MFVAGSLAAAMVCCQEGVRINSAGQDAWIVNVEDQGRARRRGTGEKGGVHAVLSRAWQNTGDRHGYAAHTRHSGTHTALKGSLARFKADCPDCVKVESLPKKLPFARFDQNIQKAEESLSRLKTLNMQMQPAP